MTVDYLLCSDKLLFPVRFLCHKIMQGTQIKPQKSSYLPQEKKKIIIML